MVIISLIHIFSIEIIVVYRVEHYEEKEQQEQFMLDVTDSHEAQLIRVLSGQVTSSSYLR